MENWISTNLSNILGFTVPDDLIQYILAINNENDLNEYMKTLLDFNDSEHKRLFLELSKKKFSNKVEVGARGIPAKSLHRLLKDLGLPRSAIGTFMEHVSKMALTGSYSIWLSREGSEHSAGNGNSRLINKKSSKNVKQSESAVSKAEVPANTEPEPKGGKKKTKYVNLYSQEGKNAQVVLLKGRNHCDCQASKHELINNCLQCGRVVCKQEGSGPCLFCGNLVCTLEEQKEINARTKSSAKLMESLMERNRPKGWEAAITHRNKLLDYDRTSERRTRVTDDDSDYFNSNSVWLSSTEREKLQKYQQAQQDKKHASRLTQKITFDFAGRQIVEEKDIINEQDLRDLADSVTSSQQAPNTHSYFSGHGGDRDVAPGVNAPLLQFDPSVGGLAVMPNYASALQQGGVRVQDAEIQEMYDSGRCLSMHQPWASLLIDGIKLHEGRTWYHSHRGRLWIASTAKPPDPEVIKTLENTYRLLYPDKELKFPTFYPTGCLLGCVSVDDCLSQEEYQKQYPGGESDSPYVFICSNPTSLRLRFPIKGQHKIYTLDKAIHQAAMKCIQKMGKMEAEANAL